MSKAQESISPQEKEKLRKRLQKLFQEQEYFEEPATGKSSKKVQQNKHKQYNNSPQMKGQKKQQFKKDKLGPESTNPKNLKKKQQQSQKKNSSNTVDTTKQNGFVKLNKKSKAPLNNQQNVNKKSKQNGFVETPVKTKETMFQQKQDNKTTKNTNEKPQKKATLLKQPAGETKKVNVNNPQKPNKAKKEEKDSNQQVKLKFQNKNIKSSPKIENKLQEKSSNTSKNKKVPQENINKIKTSPTTLNNKINKNQNKKAQKRTAPIETSSQEATASNKKLKLSNKSNKTKEKPTKTNLKNNKTKANTSLSSSSQLEDEQEFNINNMTGCVQGGDFDSDYKEDAREHKYWMQEENYSTDDDEENSANDDHDSDKKSATKNKKVEKFKKTSGSELEKYEHNNDSSDSEDDFYDEDHKFDKSYFFDSDEYDEEDEEEEEEENYSDFDENDYEEDEDSYDYGMDSEDDDYSSNYEEYGNDSSFDFNHHDDSDDDYELPKHVPEDLIIHRGTATKRDLKPEDNVSFDSDNEEAQIIELEEQEVVKVINQPKAYEREELIKLKYKENTINAITFHRKEIIKTVPATSETPKDKEEECPKLVPIVDEEGFQLYNPNEESEDEIDEEQELDEEEESFENDSMEEYEQDTMDDISLGSEYVEINSDDADSLLSEDINEKYLNRGQDDNDSDQSIDEDIWNKKHKVDIIDATGYKCVKKNDNSKDDTSDTSLNDDIKQLPSVKLFENVDLKTGSSILSTTIIDNKIFKTKDTYDKNSREFKEIPEATTTKNKQKPLKEAVTLEEQEIKEPTTVKNKQMQQDLEEQMEIEEQQGIEPEIEAVQQTKIIKPSAQSLADYYTKFFNALDSNLVLVLLKDPFYIYGTVRLTLLAGSLEIYGHSLDLNTEVEIFSPRGCSVIEISPSTDINKTSKEKLKEILKCYEKHFSLADLKSINDLYNCDKDAVVLLKRNEARKKVVQQFKKFMNENVFPNINNINVDRPLYNSEYLLRCMINTSAQEQKCLRLPRQWEQLQITSQSRVMLTGGKSVGKSTLLRYLINRHLPQQQQILLIDLDIGQPEIFIPQTVSCTIVKQPLLGPGFMLNLQPEISFAVGHTNIALCAHKYLAAVRSLISYCKSQELYKDLPWLINTMGYNKGFGLELISVIAQELPLTDVIQLQSTKEINNFDSILHAHVLSNVPRLMFAEESKENENNQSESMKYRLHVWQSAVEQESRYQKEWEMSAKDMRFAMLLARLSEALQGHAEWLTDIKPLSASLNDLKIVNLLDNTACNTTEELVKSVEANLVYLCHYQEENRPLKCLGIGVVRAVDLHIQQLYLIPAVAHSQLKEVNCVALGEMPLPTSLFTNQGSKVKNIAPFVYNTVADNASKAIKQIYHRPRKFLTGKHKSLD